jgi:anti-sigma factor RsiW
MKDRRAITDADLQDYIEGRLDPKQRAQVEARLAADPDLAKEVSRLKQQAVKLQELGQTMLDEPVPQEMLDLIEKFGRRD